ncbi:hypothetical protein F2Q68_00025800 [Brassica cretica]|uniref:Legumain prodomain domain-containing protein n=1 Tax=Brassica cretica TaxID=69181 RepID=A0A8S9IFB0_BRACR|nr:hypothetical protein F2Q68_00025800 [Brassica cretica]
MAKFYCFRLALLLLLLVGRTESRGRFEPKILMLTEEAKSTEQEDTIGARWAVLIAGSSGYGNYRHQADVCHAYQILKKGGLKEENIVVMMYDDIANHPLNPRPGNLINHPDGDDVYAGVPKLLFRISLFRTIPGMTLRPLTSTRETHNLKKETVKQQYQTVKMRTSNYNTYSEGSHVMEYGNNSIKSEKLYLYQGFDPATVNLPRNELPVKSPVGVVNQRDADLLFLWHMYQTSEDGSRKDEILKELTETTRHRKHVDTSVELIGTVLFGPLTNVLNSVREPGLPLVDDWECLKSMVRIFEMHCGWLTQYGMKHMRAFANICNNGVSKELMEEASAAACGGYEARFMSHPSVVGYSA